MDNKYPKEEKLKTKKHFTNLFNKGKWHTCGCIRMIVLEQNETPTKVGVSVSKKYFKRAVDRNRIKRLLREAYRWNKTLYQETFGEYSHSMLFWISPKMPSNFSEVEQNFIKLCKTKQG